MEEKLKKGKTFYFKLALALLFCVLIVFEKCYSKYSQNSQSQTISGIAKPCFISNFEETINVNGLNTDVVCYEFSVQNFEDEQVSETSFLYNIYFELSQKNAPVNIKLYRIIEEGKEEEIQLENNKIKAPEEMGIQEEKVNYKVYVYYNLESNEVLEDNFKIKIKIEAIQEEEEGNVKEGFDENINS
jgi:hypothetical protein